MNIYKAKVILEIVVQAETVDEAIEAIQNNTFLDGLGSTIEQFAQVHRIEDLPSGWDGGCLAFSKYALPACQEHSIRYWLEDSR